MSGLWARPKHGSEIRHKLLTGLRARICRSEAATTLFRHKLTIMNRKVSLRLPENCSALQKARRSRIGSARLLVED
jgi:hypothetical protein